MPSCTSPLFFDILSPYSLRLLSPHHKHSHQWGPSSATRSDTTVPRAAHTQTTAPERTENTTKDEDQNTAPSHHITHVALIPRLSPLRKRESRGQHLPHCLTKHQKLLCPQNELNVLEISCHTHHMGNISDSLR